MTRGPRFREELEEPIPRGTGEPQRRRWQLAEPIDEPLAGPVLVAEQESGLQRDFERVAHRRDLDKFDGSCRPAARDERKPTAGRLGSLGPGG